MIKKIDRLPGKFSNKNYRNTEEFIEDQFNIDIRYIKLFILVYRYK